MAIDLIQIVINIRLAELRRELLGKRGRNRRNNPYRLIGTLYAEIDDFLH